MHRRAASRNNSSMAHPDYQLAQPEELAIDPLKLPEQQPNPVKNQPKKDDSNSKEFHVRRSFDVWRWMRTGTPTDASYYTRNYGWDEIEQDEEYNQRLRELIAIWDAERIAILQIQQDLDKNILQRKDSSNRYWRW